MHKDSFFVRIETRFLCLNEILFVHLRLISRQKFDKEKWIIFSS